MAMKRLISGGCSLIVGVTFYTQCTPIMNDRIVPILGIMATTSGTLLGFLITAMTVLTAVRDRPLVMNMAKTGHYKVLIADTFFCCAMLMIFLLLVFVAMFFTDRTQDFVFSAALGLGVFCFYLLAVAGYRFKNVFLSLR